MFRHCLFCDTTFPFSRLIEGFPHGSRIAFDPRRMRLWAICDACHRWNLSPIESRRPAIWELERALHDRGRLLAQTAHVGLYHADPLVIVRVGEARPREEAWWRYGRELQRRHERVQSRGVRWGAYGLVAMARVGESLGLNALELDSARTDSAVTGVIRWRFGTTAWEGRTRCPYCRSVLLSLAFDDTWWLMPRTGTAGLELMVPCTRCDPWTPDNAYCLTGREAAVVLRRALAYQNVGGATDGQVEVAAERIDASGSPHGLIRTVSTGRHSLWSLGKTGALAFEIALSESIESEQLRAQARELEAAWREEGPLAEIIDRELAGP